MYSSRSFISVRLCVGVCMRVCCTHVVHWCVSFVLCALSRSPQIWHCQLSGFGIVHWKLADYRANKEQCTMYLMGMLPVASPGVNRRRRRRKQASKQTCKQTSEQTREAGGKETNKQTKGNRRLEKQNEGQGVRHGQW